MHAISNGPVGAAKGPPWHWAAPGMPAHLGSAGLVGRPGSGSSRGTGAPYMPANPGAALAGMVASAAASPMKATATAAFVIAALAIVSPLRAPAAVCWGLSLILRQEWVGRQTHRPHRAGQMGLHGVQRSRQIAVAQGLGDAEMLVHDRRRPMRIAQRRFADHP